MTDGRPIPEGVRLTLGRMPAWDLIEVAVDDDGRFRIADLPPETYEVSLRVRGLVLDTLESDCQLLGMRSFGLRLTDSCNDLVIPMRQLRVIELMFYDPRAFGYPLGMTSSGAAGKFILYPGYVRPELNRSDIRIVFDPELTTPPIDLQ